MVFPLKTTVAFTFSIGHWQLKITGIKSNLLCFENCHVLAMDPFKVKVGIVPCVF